MSYYLSGMAAMSGFGAMTGLGLDPAAFNAQQIYDWFVADATKNNHAAGKRASWYVAAALWQLGYGTSFGLNNVEIETTGPDALAVAWGDDKAKAWKAWYAKSVGGTGGYFPSSKGSYALKKMAQDLANPTPDVMGPDTPKVVDVTTGGETVADIAPTASCPPGWTGTPPNNCVPPVAPPPAVCPEGYEGTPPNCTKKQVPGPGPKPEPKKCPSGSSLKGGKCVKDTSNMGLYLGLGALVVGALVLVASKKKKALAAAGKPAASPAAQKTIAVLPKGMRLRRAKLKTNRRRHSRRPSFHYAF